MAEEVEQQPQQQQQQQQQPTQPEQKEEGESQSTPPPPPPAEEDKPTSKDPDSSSTSSPPPPPVTSTAPPLSSFSSLCLSIWPPSQRTRTAVLNRLVETLSTPSILSQRYGSLAQDEASSVARHIEEEAFSLASSSTPSPEDDGMATLQIYSREISKRMLGAVKSRSSPPPSSSDPAPAVEDSASETSESSHA